MKNSTLKSFFIPKDGTEQVFHQNPIEIVDFYEQRTNLAHQFLTIIQIM